MLCGSAFKNKGVQPMLDAVVDFLPSPLDVPAIEGTATDGETPLLRKPSMSEPFSGLAFKIQTDKHLGKLTYVRIYSGTLDSGSQVINSTKDRKERIGKIYQMHANKREERATAQAGRHHRRAGSQADHHRRHALRPGQPGDPGVDDLPRAGHLGGDRAEEQGRPGEARYGDPAPRRGGPDLPRQNDEETGQTVISGMGELHLEILVDRMRREFNVEANVGKPQVAYRETIRRTVEKVDYVHKKQTGGSGQYAKRDHQARAAAAGRRRPTYEFVNAVTGGRIPKEFIPSVDAGAQDAMQYGVLAGYPLVGREADAARRSVPRGRLVRDGVQDRRFDGAEGGGPQGRPGAARADDGRRGRHPGGQHG